MCSDCRREVRGMVYCEDCLASQVHAPPPAATAGAPPHYDSPVLGNGPSPGLALFLGAIPGVGAIYNGQYAKGFLHVVVLGILIGLAQHTTGVGEPLFGLLVFCFWAYMMAEAYHTAKKRLAGQPIDEWSGLLPPGSRIQGAAGAIILIVLGVVFLLDTLDIIRVNDIARYWPVILIVAGVLMLYRRLAPSSTESRS
jgi:hypothetical protein